MTQEQQVDSGEQVNALALISEEPSQAEIDGHLAELSEMNQQELSAEAQRLQGNLEGLQGELSVPQAAVALSGESVDESVLKKCQEFRATLARQRACDSLAATQAQLASAQARIAARNTGGGRSEEPVVQEVLPPLAAEQDSLPIAASVAPTGHTRQMVTQPSFRRGAVQAMQGSRSFDFYDAIVAAAKEDGRGEVFAPLKSKYSGNRCFDVCTTAEQMDRFWATAIIKTNFSLPQPVDPSLPVGYTELLNMPTLFNMIPHVVTNDARVPYYTSSAIGTGFQTADGAEIPEATAAPSLQTLDLARAGAIQPISETVLNDSGIARDLVNRSLTRGIMSDVEQGIVRGTGSTGQIRGFVSITGANNVAQAWNSTTNTFTSPDQVVGNAKAAIEEDNGFGQLCVLHPAYRQALISSYQPGRTPLLFLGPQGVLYYDSMPIISSSAFETPAASKVVGVVVDLTDVRLMIRGPIAYEQGRNNDDFRRFQYSLRVSLEAGLLVPRAKAVCTITRGT